VSAQTPATKIFEAGDRLLRSWWTVIAGVCLGIAGGSVALDYLPKQYEATTRVWVTPQEIPESLVRSAVRDDLTERLLTFRNAVLGQPYMEELIEKTFGDTPSGSEMLRIIDHVKSSLDVSVEEGEGRGAVTLIALTYRDAVPERTADVVNNLTQLFVDQNQRFRIAQTERSSDQLAQMANDAKASLDRAEQALAEFNKRHPFAERSVEDNLDLIEDNREEAANVATQRARVEEDIRALRLQLQRAHASPNDSGVLGVPVDPLAQELATARTELAALRMRLTEEHPDLKRQVAHVAELEQRMAARGAGPNGEAAVNPAVAELERQIDARKREMDELAKRERDLLARNDALRSRIDGTTQTAPQLNKLLEDRRIAETRYRELQMQAAEIATSRDIERAELGEKMEILELAKVPTRPVKPDPTQVYLLGIAFGCLLFIGPVIGRHLTNPIIGSEAAVVAVAEFPIVVTIPRIVTPTNVGDTRRLWAKNVLLSLLAVTLLTVAMLV
jgi:uncharacterized protein involved in exopolysaccharide biosynthesis